MKKRLIAFICLAFINLSSKAQLLFYQNTFKGGISFDGVTYSDYEWLQADTVNFHNSVPLGCTLKKAFLISFKISCSFINGAYPQIDPPVTLKFNNQNIQFDSSTDVTPVFYSNNTTTNGQCWVTTKDVTTIATSNNNSLIIPCQSCVSNLCNYYEYFGFYLVLIYENITYNTINVAIYLNNATYTPTMSYVLNGLNPINTTNDVGLSIESANVDVSPYLTYQLTSTTNTVTLGTLRNVSLNNVTDYKTGLGSFHYENGILSGLVDDSPDAFIDTTDALANIKTYLPNNTSTFSLTSNTSFPVGFSHDNNFTTAFVTAYNTPCAAVPATADSIRIYKLCTGQTAQLNATGGYSNYNWQPATNLSNANIANPIVTTQNTTNYICYIKDAAGCMHTEQAQIIVHPPPIPQSITTTTAICGSTQGVLAITPNYHHYGYMYNINNGAAQTDTVFSNLSAGLYTLTITDNFACTYKDPFTITQVNLAKANFNLTPISGCEPLSVSCNNISNYNGNVYDPVTNKYVWYTNGDSATTQNFSYTYTDTGLYTITLLAYENLRNCSATATQTVYVKDCPPDSIKIIVPNVFSPNADGINDTWQPIVHNFNYTINNYECTIYDRWGIKVFATADIN